MNEPSYLWDGPSEENYSISLPLGLQEFFLNLEAAPGDCTEVVLQPMGSKVALGREFPGFSGDFQHLGHRGVGLGG